MCRMYCLGCRQVSPLLHHCQNNQQLQKNTIVLHMWYVFWGAQYNTIILQGCPSCSTLNHLPRRYANTRRLLDPLQPFYPKVHLCRKTNLRKASTLNMLPAPAKDALQSCIWPEVTQTRLPWVIQVFLRFGIHLIISCGPKRPSILHCLFLKSFEYVFETNCC